MSTVAMLAMVMMTVLWEVREMDFRENRLSMMTMGAETGRRRIALR
jgi:hypothetical protein